jgi:hypothetical protein
VVYLFFLFALWVKRIIFKKEGVVDMMGKIEGHEMEWILDAQAGPAISNRCVFMHA